MIPGITGFVLVLEITHLINKGDCFRPLSASPFGIVSIEFLRRRGRIVCTAVRQVVGIWIVVAVVFGNPILILVDFPAVLEVFEEGNYLFGEHGINWKRHSSICWIEERKQQIPIRIAPFTFCKSWRVSFMWASLVTSLVTFSLCCIASSWLPVSGSF